MSTYEERMAEKYGFFSKDDETENKNVNEPKVTESSIDKEEIVENLKRWSVRD